MENSRGAVSKSLTKWVCFPENKSYALPLDLVDRKREPIQRVLPSLCSMRLSKTWFNQKNRCFFGTRFFAAGRFLFCFQNLFFLNFFFNELILCRPCLFFFLKRPFPLVFDERLVGALFFLLFILFSKACGARCYAWIR